uniref:Uncharacterized protein n=1 Tax=Arundo donax TaxID=35708 RepID=A0A0A8ZI10_ARUDO
MFNSYRSDVGQFQFSGCWCGHISIIFGS